jgi:hypothetical protein
MAFPGTRLPILAEAALGADLTADPSDWAWTDVTDYVRIVEANPVMFTHGRLGGVLQAAPDQLNFTVDNRDGRWCAHNPIGAWYGQIGLGTPVRFTVSEGTPSIRITAFVAALPPSWNDKETDRYVRVTAAGVTRRLGRNKSPLRSALTRSISGTSTPPKAYWPCEDPSGSTSFAEFFGGKPMEFGDGITLADDGPDGSAPLPVFVTHPTLNGVVPTHTATGEWMVANVLNFPAAVTAETAILRWYTSGSLPMWQLVLAPGSPDTISLEAYDSSGVRQLNDVNQFVINTVTEPYGLWILYAASAVQNGTNIDYTASWNLDDGSGSGVIASTSGITGTVLRVGLPASDKLNGIHVGHWAAWDVSLDPFNFADLDSTSLNGYDGELAFARVLRLTDEEGISVEPDSITVDTMGPQPVATLMQILREAEAVTDGRLLDNRDPTAFGSQLRIFYHTDIENRAVDMALDHDLKHLNPPFDPQDDDQWIRNDVTASRSGGSSNPTTPSGSSARYVKDYGRLTPALIGTYDDSVTVNVELDSDLIHQAGWRVNLGTVEGLRFPRLTLDFARNPSLIPDWIGIEVGSRITVANPPTGLSREPIDVIVEGWAETFGPFGWSATLNCAPFAPYKVGEYAGENGDANEWIGRYAEDEPAAIRQAITDSGLSVEIDPNRQRWTTRLGWDTFTRSSSSAWGTSDGGQVWGAAGGVASTFTVSGTQGQHVHAVANVLRESTLDISSINWDITVDLSWPVNSATTASLTRWICGRYTDTANYYVCRLDLNTAGVVVMSLNQRVATVLTTLVTTFTVDSSYVADTIYRVRFAGRTEASGKLVMGARAWIPASEDDPVSWMASYEDTTPDLTSGTLIAVGSRAEAGNTNVPITMSWDNVGVSDGAGGDPDDFPLNIRLVSGGPTIAGGGETATVSAITTTPGTFVAVGAASSADNAAVTPALYAGGSTRDLIVIVAAIRSSGTGTLATPTGYTRLPVFNAVDNVQLFAKVHTGSESNPTVTPSGGAAGDTVTAFTAGFRGTPSTLTNLADIVVDSLTLLNAAATNIAYPGLYTRLVEGCINLLVGWRQDDYTSIAVPSGWTEALEASSTTANDQGLYLAYRIDTTPLVINEGSLVVTTGGGTAISRGAVVALAAGYQTLTVTTRATNGVTKAHSAGTKIEVQSYVQAL